MSRRDRLIVWADGLTELQLREAIIELTSAAIDAEDVSFYDTALVPYWSNTGDPVVQGQVAYVDES